jgi:hypothetical protein
MVTSRMYLLKLTPADAGHAWVEARPFAIAMTNQPRGT